jgi:hypothetical protein
VSVARHVILGLPASGKTTYLAALWHLIDADEVDCGLTLDRVVGNVVHLNEIAEAWRTFQPVERTSQTGDIDVSMHVTVTGTDATSELLFPDLAGESFNNEVERRRVSQKYLDDHRDADGALLFITVNKGEDELTVAELNARLPQPAEAVNDTDGEAVEWDPSKTVTQVRLVQILSDLFDAPFDGRPRKLAIVLSAWDVLPKTRPKPDKWLADHMPFLDQFLASNAAVLDCRIYGVSAQGCDLKNVNIGEMSGIAASERIIVQGHRAAKHDLAAPLVWLMTGK